MRMRRTLRRGGILRGLLGEEASAEGVGAVGVWGLGGGDWDAEWGARGLGLRGLRLLTHPSPPPQTRFLLLHKERR